MATEKYPQQNVNMPMDEAAVQAARDRAAPHTPTVPTSTGTSAAAQTSSPTNGSGGRREVRPGEWIDDRRLELDRPASPSKDSPPEAPAERAVPASYDPLKVYSVTLGKPVTFCGRVLSPSKSYQMVGDTCTEITTKDAAAIADAIEIGDVPVEPDVSPSAAKKA